MNGSFSVSCNSYAFQVEEGGNALIEACKKGHTTTARVLIDHGAIIDFQNEVKTRIHRM